MNVIDLRIDMFRRMVLGIVMLTMLFVGMLALTSSFEAVGASGTIYIRADGSIDPPTAPISTVDNIKYVLTSNINDAIVVERSNIIIDGNTYTVQAASPTYGVGFTIHNISNVTIINTNIRDFRFGIDLWDAPGCIISRNNITNNGLEGTSGAGIQIMSWNCKITGNKIAENALRGMNLQGASDCIISGNYITANNWSGIRLDMCANLEITGNNITANNRSGIAMDDSFTNTISENNITNNGGGVYLYSCYNNTIVENRITHNLLQGIWLDGESYDNTFVGNNITDNDRGMHVTNTTYANSIYHNNFINNTVQAYSEGFNVWDHGYPSGGNYWSNYTGIDSNGDGIGDTPYIILGSEADRYPRMNPTIYVVTIRAYCQMQGVSVKLLITWINNLRANHMTPQTFGLGGIHRFTLQCVDPHGHQLDKWNTGRLFQTIVVDSGGTYTAYYTQIVDVRGPGGNGGNSWISAIHHLNFVR